MKEGEATWPAVRAQVTTEDGETLDVLMTMAEESGLTPKELLKEYQEEPTDQAARRVLVFVYLTDPFGLGLPKYKFDVGAKNAVNGAERIGLGRRAKSRAEEPAPVHRG